MSRRKVLRFHVVITAHVFEKIRSIDMTLAEFRELLGTGEVPCTNLTPTNGRPTIEGGEADAL